MTEWKSQNVLDELTLEDITDDVLQDFQVQKLQRVVLLKWKRQVLEGKIDGNARLYPTPSRSADRSSRGNSLLPPGRNNRNPASHLYTPGRSMDRRSVDRRYPSRTPIRQVRGQRGGHLSELFAHFDKSTGWVDQTKLHELMFATLLVHRRRILDSDPHAPMLSKAEIRPLVNGLVWEVMKQIDQERGGYLSEPEYVQSAHLLIAEFDKVVAKAKSKPESDDSDEEKNDTAEVTKRSQQVNMTPVNGEEQRRIGQQLMMSVLRRCKTWNAEQGTSHQLVAQLKELILGAEHQLRRLESTI